MRNFSQEHQNLAERKYSYDFDDILRHYMMRTFEPFLIQGRALEMGCYKGAFTTLLANKYDDLTVVEAAADLIEETSQRVGNRVKFIHSTFETLELTDRYDAIFLMHTLEHIDETALVLGKARDWLSEKGLLFLVVPNANAPSRQIAVKMGLIPYNSAVTEAEFKHGHRRTYTFDTLERDVTAVGLNPVHRGGVFFKPLANYQLDQLLESKVITKDYLEGCFKLGMQYPDLCASIYLICSKNLICHERS